MYIAQSEYNELYDPIDEKLFKRISLDACRVMDTQTTGIDNVKKLKMFFPENKDDTEAVKHCAARLINTMYQVHKAETAVAGFDITDQGVHGKVISSVTAGNESISYATGSATVIDEAARDINARSKLYGDIVCDYLRGIVDRNGVNLLYRGAYPRRFLC